MKKGDKVLDFGCFYGILTSMLNEDTSAKCIGVDINIPLPKPYLVQYDGKTIPFKDQEFDYFVSFEVLEHVEDAENTLKEYPSTLMEIWMMGFVTKSRHTSANVLNAENAMIHYKKPSNCARRWVMKRCQQILENV